MSSTYDIAIVGAGPAGLATALHARQRGLRAVLIDKGSVANYILDFPYGMTFFVPRHTLELQGIPLDTPRLYPSREEVVSYYMRLARLAELDIRDHETFERVEGSDGDFRAITRTRRGESREYRCRKVVLATGVFGQPRRLPAIPGANHSKVEYLYREPFRYAGKDVLLVGAGNSSAGAALALYHAGARVTVVDRNPSLAPVKWRWHFDDLRQLVASGAIRVLSSAKVTEIEDDTVSIDVAGDVTRIANDAVVVLLGYEPDTRLLEKLGIAIDPATKMPRVDVHTLESNVPGVYLAGIMCAGTSPDKVFVLGARNHPKAVLRHILHEPPLDEVKNLGPETIEHWRQFEKVADDIDEELAMQLAPVVSGDLRDDLFDVYTIAMGGAGLHPEPLMATGEPQPVGPVLTALDGWLVQRNDDGSVVFKGQRLSANAFEILRFCDGTRRLSDVVTAVAAEFEQPVDEVKPLVVSLVISLLRSGRLTWRSHPTPSPRP